MRDNLLNFIAASLFLFVMTCHAKDIKPTNPGHGSPSAYHCENSMGKFESTDQPEEIGLCTFDSHGVIGSWTYFRYRHGQSQKAVTAFCESKNNPQTTDFPGPQVEYCKKVGGTPIEYRISTRKLDQAVTVCGFDDNSHVEVNTLFRGAKDPDQKILNRILCCIFDTEC